MLLAFKAAGHMKDGGTAEVQSRSSAWAFNIQYKVHTTIG